MAEKLSDKLKGLFKRADTYLGKAIEKKPKSTKAIGPSQTQYKMFKAGQKTKGLLTGKTIKNALKQPGATGDLLKRVGKLKTIGRVASRVALPVALGVEGASLAYKVATLSPEKKAKVKKLKSKLSKKSTKQSHADLLKMSTGGDTMLTGGQKKLDKNKDGKISGEDFKMMKPKGAVLGAIALGALGAKKLMGNKKSSASPISPVIRLEDKKNQTTGSILMPGDKENQQQPQTTGQASKGKMMKAYKGDMAKGYGAARTQGQGLQDENLIPGKSLDYYKDIM